MPSVLPNVPFLCSYAQSLASTRILKHSEQSSRGSCGENLAWASYDQSGGAFIMVSTCRNLLLTVQPAGMLLWSSLWFGIVRSSWDPFPLPLYFRGRRHDSLQKHLGFMRRLCGAASGYKCNDCKQLVDWIHRRSQHIHSA